MSLAPREVGKYFFLCKMDLFVLGRYLSCNGAAFSFTMCRGVSLQQIQGLSTLLQ